MHQHCEGVHDLVVGLHPEASSLNLLAALPSDQADQAFNLVAAQGVLLWIFVGEKIQGLSSLHLLEKPRGAEVYSFVLLGKELAQDD